MTALRTGDAELARGVIARDSEIDSAEHEIEHRCLTLSCGNSRWRAICARCPRP